MVSLAEQLMKAGLVDKKKVKQVNQDKSKQQKIERRTGVEAVNEAREAALETQRKNAERARELNAQRDAAATQKAIMAQIVQMVQQNKQPKTRHGKDDVPYNFTFGTRIERLYVSPQVQEHLVAGRLVIVGINGSFELVPRVIAEKIAERDASLVVQVKKASQPVDEDDPYAAYKIPDDLMW
ncbi:DUF2058 domain-containing protein [Massilia sp. ST3]|uniref:DUF2058 domain-containing protein n=1 Tax=Massilia sp. ST3 TaxID=2824903 RepID=UPI001B830834|nr:DUF2058 domain-containing protein [Massilia sp. ST3]MBQ5946583.1 DUF2058 domain-containing protein [Massilia sp. ST3]